MLAATKQLYEWFSPSVCLSVCPIDKAANNVGLICKKYFLEILRKETSTETYEEYDNTAEEVIGAIRKVSSNIGIPVEKTFMIYH